MHSTRVCSGTGGGTRRCELAIPTTTRLRAAASFTALGTCEGGESGTWLAQGNSASWGKEVSKYLRKLGHTNIGLLHGKQTNTLHVSPEPATSIRAPTGPLAHTTEESASATHSPHRSGAAPAIVQTGRRLSCSLACHYQATPGGRGTVTRLAGGGGTVHLQGQRLRCVRWPSFCSGFDFSVCCSSRPALARS